VLEENARRFMAANRALWDEWTNIHVRSDFYDVAGFKAGRINLRDYEIAEVGDVAGKDMLHLQCHFGMDTLSWARLGARVTGADYSENAITRARGLSEELGIPAKFVRSNLYDLPDALGGVFDIVYTSRGVLGWLPDIEGWADVAAHYVRPGGIFYITEMHPIAAVFDDDEGTDELRVRYPYWHTLEPLAWPTQGSYADPTATVESPTEYGWQHSLGEIVTALASRGLVIEFLHEFDFVDWEAMPCLQHHPEEGTWRLPDGHEGQIPLFFSLRAAKPL
jgi:SAM-dependent methyltransferase